LAGAEDIGKRAGLNITEFVEFIAQLLGDLYGKETKSVADHLQNVVRCFDGRVALAASRSFVP
jgi:hypothetical protein